MNDSADDRKVAAAARTLMLLNGQADEARLELHNLRQDLVRVQRDFSETRVAQLLEANEKLVIAALRAESAAETAASNLDELERSRQLDALTQIPNRVLMLDRLETAIAQGRRRDSRIAVLFVDIDRFKHINDTRGHAVGDEVLKLVAHRLESVVRQSDTVSRHGGDEFLVLLSDVAQASDAAGVAAKMLTTLAAPASVSGETMRVSASIGITIYPDDGTDAATLVGRADQAMYRSKNHGRGCYAFWDERIPVVSHEPDGEHSVQSTLARLELGAGRHSTDADLREANEHLVIAAMSAQEVEARAEETHRQQIHFLAMVAHELRNPLMPIRTAAALLNRAFGDEQLLSRVQVIIERQVAHMTRLVNDLLDGSRVSTGKFRLERSLVEIATVLSVSVETCRPAMDARMQHLKVEMPLTPLIVHGDAVRLAQVFSNLLDNASKYTPRGGAIALQVVSEPHATVICVSDNGSGITAEALPHIFDLFVQDPRALVLHNGGLGIGLAVARDLVEAHGGTISASSAGGDLGSQFVVTLPISDGRMPARY
jgi:diguanylate cyclase (GGDEF)-like protein